MMFFSFPDVATCGLYIPAEVPMVLAGLSSAHVTVRLLQFLGISHRFSHPALVFTTLSAGYSALTALVLT